MSTVFSRCAVAIGVAGVLAAGLFVPAAQAAVTTVAHYRLGENDPGALAGQPGQNPTRDLTGNYDLAINPNYVSPGHGALTYSADVPWHKGGDTVTLQVANPAFGYTDPNGAYYVRGSAVSTARDNFGLETWVKASMANNPSRPAIVEYGEQFGASTSGIGFEQIGTNYYCLINGIAAIVLGPVSTTSWTHLAAVRDNGVMSFYVNGVAIGTTNSSTPITPTNFLIGAGMATGESVFAGYIDEVRLFTFAPGSFSPQDLFYYIPEPASLALLGLAAVLPVLRRRR